MSYLTSTIFPIQIYRRKLESLKKRRKGSMAGRYPVGWCVCGSYGANCRQGVSANFVSIDSEPRFLIEKFWNLEDYATLKSNEKPL